MGAIKQFPIVSKKDIKWKDGMPYIRRSVNGSIREYHGNDVETLLIAVNDILSRALSSGNRKGNERETPGQKEFGG
jgi:hypothetical protein